MRAFFLCLCLLLPLSAHAWWDEAWAARKKLSADPGAAGELVDFPVLVRLHTGNFDFYSAKPDGADLRFVAGDDKTPLAFHVEKWDALNEMALVWVRLPKLAGPTDFWLYWNNPQAAPAADAAATYGPGTRLVYHFANDGPPADATGNALNATASDAAAVSASVIGPGLSFQGGQSVTTPLLPAGEGFTFSAWFRPDDKIPAAGTVFSQGALALALDAGRPVIRVDGRPVVEAASPLAAGQWAHVAVTVSDRLRLYVNGALSGEGDAAAFQDASAQGAITLGATAGGSFLTGGMDEVEIATLARAPGYLQALHASQGPEGNFLSYGTQEGTDGAGEDGAGEASYFKVILQSVTLDGWVVIAILAVIALVSWVVMAMKALYINRLDRANRGFMERFRALGADLTRLDWGGAGEDRTRGKDAAFASVGAAAVQAVPGRRARSAGEGAERALQDSSLYRIYHIGVEEIRRRFRQTGQSSEPGLAGEPGPSTDAGLAGGRGSAGAVPGSAPVSIPAPPAGAPRLSAASLDAIRATLDAGLTRETHRLDRLMVLLTIAISGGPFLGLLGTVVGVMITFAAIAASGDVNVNAIAPGIAAALVATVAGLVVAIPALFGYNYLASRIKTLTADMRVFVDEFVTRVAETYGT